MPDLTINRTEDGTDALDRWGKISAKTIRYEVFGIASKGDVLQAVFAAAPRDIPDMMFDGVEAKEVKEGYAVVYANYKTGQEPDSVTNEEEATISCEVSTVSMHVEKGKFPSEAIGSENDKDPGYLIGWNFEYSDKKVVKGVDIQVPVMRLTYTKSVPNSRLDVDYLRTVHRWAGCINTNSFKGWNAGEVLFLGLSFDMKNSTSKTVVNYHFSIAPNESDVEVEGINVPLKLGHDYLWYHQTFKPETGEIDKTYLFEAKPYVGRNFSYLGV